MVGANRALDLDCETFAGELVNDIQKLELTSVGDLVELEVHRPDDVGGNRAHGAYLHPQSLVGAYCTSRRALSSLPLARDDELSCG